MLMSPSIQQMRSYTWLKRHLPKEVVLEVQVYTDNIAICNTVRYWKYSEAFNDILFCVNPFVHSSIHGGYFIIWLWISVASIQNEIFKSSKDPVLCICMNFKKSFLHSVIPCQIKALWFKVSEGVATFAKILNFGKFLET